jgi:hypothetical protein
MADAAPAVFGWAGSTAVYLAAFLVGIREARWFGSRLWPAVPVGILYMSFDQSGSNSFPVGILYLFLMSFGASWYSLGEATLVVVMVLFGAILYAASERND